MILRSVTFLSLIVHCIALVTKTGEKAHGISILPGQSSDDEEVVKEVEADVVGDRELNAQSPTHGLMLTAARTQVGDATDDAEEVADKIEKESQNTDATLATSVVSNAEDEEVVKVVEADVVQANETDTKVADEADTKDEQDDGDDDDDDSDDEAQAQDTHLKPHPSEIQMIAPKIKIANVAAREVASSHIRTAKVAVRTVAPSKQATNATTNASKPQVQLAAMKKNLRIPEVKSEEQLASDSPVPDPGEAAQAPEGPQTQAEETAIVPQDEAPIPRSRSNCDEGNEFNTNDC